MTTHQLQYDKTLPLFVKGVHGFAQEPISKPFTNTANSYWCPFLLHDTGFFWFHKAYINCTIASQPTVH